MFLTDVPIVSIEWTNNTLPNIGLTSKEVNSSPCNDDFEPYYIDLSNNALFYADQIAGRVLTLLGLSIISVTAKADQWLRPLITGVSYH